jgi:hypothetical protein
MLPREPRPALCPLAFRVAGGRQKGTPNKATAEIKAPAYEGDGTLVRIQGNNVTVRDGTLSTADATPLESVGHGTALERMTFGGVGGIALKGRRARMIDSRASSRFGVTFAGEAVIDRNEFGCVYDCVFLHGERNRVTNNRVSAADGVAIEIGDDDNFLAWNTVEGGGPFTVVLIGGDHNVVRGNTIDAGEQRAIIDVRGTANTLDGNIAHPTAVGSRASIGIAFGADGNYYGDNRMAASVPFQLGSTVQTDWGGNVGY